MTKTTLTFTLMDPPFETERSTTAFRLMQIAAGRGYNINVFAYEGAVYLPFFEANSLKIMAFTDTRQKKKNHPLTKNLLRELQKLCTAKGKLDWVNCGLCVDERALTKPLTELRGSPADLLAFTESSDGNLVIGTR